MEKWDPSMYKQGSPTFQKPQTNKKDVFAVLVNAYLQSNKNTRIYVE